MENIVINAEEKLMSIAHCIGRYDKCWEGFSVLRIMVDGAASDIFSAGNIFLPAKSIIESYLGNLDGRAYYCEKSLHIVCKGSSVRILSEAGSQICDFLSADCGVSFHAVIYDLDTKAEQYSEVAEQDCRDGLFLSATQFEFEKQYIMPEDTKVKRQNIQMLTKVLLVEDDPVTRWMVRSSLKNECEFACAPTAHKAFSMYSSFNPDVVFLDINLPDDTGYSVLQWIMNNDPGACVVMFSSNNNLSTILESLEKGAMGFISKPYIRDNLIQYINRAVN